MPQQTLSLNDLGAIVTRLVDWLQSQPNPSNPAYHLNEAGVVAACAMTIACLLRSNIDDREKALDAALTVLKTCPVFAEDTYILKDGNKIIITDTPSAFPPTKSALVH